MRREYITIFAKLAKWLRGVVKRVELQSQGGWFDSRLYWHEYVKKSEEPFSITLISMNSLAIDILAC